MDRQKVEAFAQKALSWQYAEGGREEGAVDCWGLVVCFAREMGFDMPDYRDAVTVDQSGGNLFLENYHRHAIEIEKSRMQPGDLVLFRRRGVLQHIGINIGGGQFLHCDKSGVTRARLYEQPHSRQAAVYLRLAGSRHAAHG